MLAKIAVLDILDTVRPARDAVVRIDAESDDEDAPACALVDIDPLEWLGMERAEALSYPWRRCWSEAPRSLSGPWGSVALPAG
ncbi:MAG: hypothetical protein ACRDQ7_02760 [Haloechinothrix sp.]